MSLTKVNYIDNSTVITAQNLNDIQDNIIQNAELIKKAAPRNLLDNSDFRNPVNQRGQTSYTLNGYTIDRWLIWNGSVTVSDGYITANEMFQLLDLPLDKVYTLAACTDDGSIAMVTAIPLIAGGAVNGGLMVGLTNLNGYAEVFVSGGKNIVWAALYEGEYTAETLPEYQPKEYAVELAECQRYYQVHLIISEKSGWDYTNRVIPVPCAMRTIPTITHTIMEGSGTVEAATAVNNQFIYLTCSDIKTYMGVLVQLSADL